MHLASASHQPFKTIEFSPALEQNRPRRAIDVVIRSDSAHTAAHQDTALHKDSRTSFTNQPKPIERYSTRYTPDELINQYCDSAGNRLLDYTAIFVFLLSVSSSPCDSTEHSDSQSIPRLLSRGHEYGKSKTLLVDKLSIFCQQL